MHLFSSVMSLSKWRVSSIAAAVLLLTCSSAQAALIMGGFDFSRGGYYSLRNGSSMSDLRTDITASFPGVTFTASSTLTDSYLNSIDVLLLASPTGFGGSVNTGITPLTAAEQGSLLNFVKRGGSALIFTDNNYAFESFAASNSLVTPFGVHSTGLISGNGINATITNTTNLVTNGPFGAVTSYTTDYPGWFDSLGTHAISLARLPNGQSTLALIDWGALSATSGAVVLSSDSNIIWGAPNDPRMRLINNAIAFVQPRADVPEPATLTLLGIGALGMMGYGWCRKAAKSRA